MASGRGRSGAEATASPPARAADRLAEGREAYDRHEWTRAYEALSEADRLEPLALAELERLSVAAYLLGRDDESIEVLTRLHHESLEAGEVPAAGRAAFWLAFRLMNRGEVARGGGWMARAHSLLDDGPDCVERGYLLVPKALGTVRDDPAAGSALFAQAEEIGARFGDADLQAIGRLGRGEALIRLGDVAEGATLLDEAMIAVDAGEVSPVVAGILYCAVIEACRYTFDLRRAQEWTAVLTDWCAAQPDLVPYRGQCLVHRSEIMQLRGEWADAMEEVRRAQERLSDPPGQPAVGMAYYQRGELHRLRGEVTDAEEAYRQAADWGRTAEPGLALLRLAQGRTDAAEAMIRRALAEATNDADRARLLGAAVEIMLAVGQVEAAREAADELSQIAERLGAPALDADAARATAAVLLEEGDPAAAMTHLRRAASAWGELGAPYEAARVRVLMGLACRAQGDDDTADMEMAAARRVFEETGARPALAHLDTLDASRPAPAGGLTRREVEVLRLVAAGQTNREIAETLVISERTVARHMSNIFTKLGLSNRAAATAYAYEHDLV